MSLLKVSGETSGLLGKFSKEKCMCVKCWPNKRRQNNQKQNVQGGRHERYHTHNKKNKTARRRRVTKNRRPTGNGRQASGRGRLTKQKTQTNRRCRRREFICLSTGKGPCLRFFFVENVKNSTVKPTRLQDIIHSMLKSNSNLNSYPSNELSNEKMILIKNIMSYLHNLYTLIYLFELRQERKQDTRVLYSLKFKVYVRPEKYCYC